MKKVSRKQRDYFIRASQREMRRRVDENKKRNRKKEERFGYHVIYAPRRLCLFERESRKRTLSFIGSIHKSVNKGKKKIWLDFTGLESVVADGMILLHAELSRIVNVLNLCVKSTPPKDKVVSQVFKQIEFSVVAGCNIRRTSESERKDVATWRCASGEGVLGEKCGNILSHYHGRIAQALSRQLFTGMTEAMTNAHQHAYIKERGDRIKHVDFFKPWWLFSQEIDGKLNVIFCDLGLGIPHTLPLTRPSLVMRLSKALGKDITDSRSIKEAIEDSKSRTNQSHRGKGLKQVVETIDESDDGKVFILSNKGSYSHTAEGYTQLRDFSTSIRGTIVCWQVSLPEASGFDDARNFQEDAA